MERRAFSVLMVACLLTAGSILAENSSDDSGIVAFYRQHYPFSTMKDTIYTFQSEFVLPEGYRRPDSSQLTAYQNWVANFPLWHRYISVGNWKGGKVIEYSEISRPVHLPWHGMDFKDKAIPIRILAEFLHYQGREFDLRIQPPVGDTLRYESFLGGKLRYTSRREPFFEPDVEREPSLTEFYRFMKVCMHNTSLASLAANCDSVTADDLAPGDLFLAHDERGVTGVAYVVMHLLVNEKGSRLYVVATGCSDACDFHIPLLTEDRNQPWITADQIRSLANGLPFSGFLRFRGLQ
ncbi:MAG: hypothetical protein KAU35_08105 [candidate division Zixibacteria bacterium]|nr:hypothetical protein [candidate division Zixibacteria bacterium]